MSEHDPLRTENERLRARLDHLTEAILRISEDLDLDVVLQRVVDSARSLTGARYGAISTLDGAGALEDLLISGLAPDEERQLMAFPEGNELFRYLSTLPGPLRTADFVAHAMSAGFAGFDPPIGTFLTTQIKVRDRQVGNVFIAEKDGGEEFTREDEATLEMFAAQAAAAVTNARRYREEQRAKADLEALLDTSPVGVLVFDAATLRLEKLNGEACRLVGVPDTGERDLDRLLGHLTLRRIDGTAMSRDELPLVRAATRGETVRAEEVVIEAPGGESVTTLVNATPIRDEDGEIVTVILAVQDITPLEEMERLRAEFLGMVSHELRAPLTSIKGSAATVRSSSGPLDPAETRQFFRIIEEQADHMRDLINNLLDMTRIEAGTLSVAPEPTDLGAVIDQATSAFSSGGHRSSIEVDIAPNLPRVWADGRRIVQVLYNLLSNASKYSREWSTISVGASPQGVHVAVSVTDEGVGIARERLPRLFTKFSRARNGDGHTDGDGQPDGYGLGLAICRGIVQAHGGRIWAESDGPGLGTRLTFTIPAVDEVAVAPETGPDPDAAEPGRPPSRIERILAIDDDPQTLRYIRNTLSRAGFAATLVGSADGLEHLLDKEKPDLVLLNMVLPGISGFEVMGRIPRILDVPVIILSGRGSDRDVARAFEMGVADYVVKPFSPSELLARITAVLRRQALSRQSEPFRVGDLVVDYVTRTVSVAGRATSLTPTEYKLLFELCSNAGRVLNYDQLIQQVWGAGSTGDAQRVRTFVKDLRRKLGDDARSPRYIVTVPGVGYRAATV